VTRRFALIVAMVVSFAGSAVAKSKIAIAPIDGDESEEMADALETAIDGSELDVTGTRSTGRMLDRLGYDIDLTSKQAKKLGAELDVDAVLVGSLATKDGHKVLHFHLYVRGKKTRGFTVTFNNARSDRFKLMLREKLVDKIENPDDARSAKADDEEDDDEGRHKKKRRDHEDEDDDGPRAKKKHKRHKKHVADRDEDDEEDEEADEAEEDEDGVHVRASGRPANRVALRFDLGVSVQNRSLAFTSRKNNFPQAPNPYSNAPVPGMRFDVELYPLAFSKPNSFAAGLGIAAAFDRTFALSLSTTDEPGVPVKATQQQWSAGVRLRIPFGGPRLPSLTLAGDYGVRAFTTDRGGLMDPASLDLPDTKYTFVAGGLDLRFPLAGTVALVVDGRAIGVLDAGPIQQPEQYGQARVFGVQAAAGLDIVLRGRYAIRFAGELSQFGFAFVGNGAMSNSRDNDPTSKDVGGAADRSIGGAATFGVVY
jgi:hypothetical protein